MRPEKCILLIDDESQNNDLENIQRNLISEIDVSFSQIEVLNSEHIDNNANFDIEKFKSNLFDFMKREHYDLVLVDYDYGAYVEISGLDVIDIIREEYKSIDIVLYSADQKKVTTPVSYQPSSSIYFKEFSPDKGICLLDVFRWYVDALK